MSSPLPFNIPVRTKNILKLLLIIVSVLFALWSCIKIASYILPFVVAFLFAQLMEPFVRLLMRKCHLSRKISAIITLILLFGSLTLLSVLGISRIIHEIFDLVQRLPDFAVLARAKIQEYNGILVERLGMLNPDLVNFINSLLNNILQSLFSAAKTLAVTIVSGAINVPRMILFLAVLIISTVFLTIDRDKILQFAKRQLPDAWIDGVLGVRDSLLGALFGYFKAQGKIMIVVFIELLIGMTILGARYAFLTAISIAVLDALPIFGSGAVLIPAALFNIFFGDLKFGIGCAILYVCTIVLRQILEPKVLGNEIGLHPLVTLTSMYAGFNLAGFIGLIGGPVSILIIRNILNVYLSGRTIKEYIAGEPKKAKPEENTVEKKNRKSKSQPPV